MAQRTTVVNGRAPALGGTDGEPQLSPSTPRRAEGDVRVLLVDDHPVVRAGLREMLGTERGIEVIGEASGGEEGLDKVTELAPDVVLMDIMMPGMSGLEATRRIKKAHPTTSVLMLTMYDSEVYVVEALRAGAAGYLVKDASRELVCHAIRTVTHGGMPIRSGLLSLAIEGLRPRPQGGDGRVDSPVLARLTQRELDVLRLLINGYSNKRIGSELYLAEVTVKKHVQSIIGKLGVSDRTQAAVHAVRMGLAA